MCDAGGEGDVLEESVPRGAGTGEEIVLFGEVVANAGEFVDEAVLAEVEVGKIVELVAAHKFVVGVCVMVRM